MLYCHLPGLSAVVCCCLCVLVMLCALFGSSSFGSSLSLLPAYGADWPPRRVTDFDCTFSTLSLSLSLSLNLSFSAQQWSPSTKSSKVIWDLSSPDFSVAAAAASSSSSLALAPWRIFLSRVTAAAWRWFLFSFSSLVASLANLSLLASIGL